MLDGSVMLPVAGDVVTSLVELYINGELIGGCDIVVEMYHSGELKTLLEGADA